MMKILKNSHFESEYFVVNEEGMTIGAGKTPLEAACNAAEHYYSPGSLFWHQEVIRILQETEDEILNHWENPFEKDNA